MSSLKFTSVYINDFFTVVGQKESAGKLKKFDFVIDDYYFGEKTFELAEIKMQKTIIDNLLARNNLLESEIDCLVGGELSNQLTATNYNAKNYSFPILGVYSACASYVESLIILSNLVNSGQMKKGFTITSSHNLTAEKQFRFPVEYGAPKNSCSSHTATGACGNYLSNTKSKIKIESATIGSVIEYGIKDAGNMGAIMAPAAAETLTRHLHDLNRDANYYDLILTGDLGEIGSKIFKEFLKATKNLSLTNHLDSACEIYTEEQKVNAGASGPVALPIVMWNKIIRMAKYKKILLIATGSLHSPIMVNQKLAVPAIAHAISLEVTK